MPSDTVLADLLRHVEHSPLDELFAALGQADRDLSTDTEHAGLLADFRAAVQSLGSELAARLTDAEDWMPSWRRDSEPDSSVRVCVSCGREGMRQFTALTWGGWRCATRSACDRRAARRTAVSSDA